MYIISSQASELQLEGTRIVSAKRCLSPPTHFFFITNRKPMSVPPELSE